MKNILLATNAMKKSNVHTSTKIDTLLAAPVKSLVESEKGCVLLVESRSIAPCWCSLTV